MGKQTQNKTNSQDDEPGLVTELCDALTRRFRVYTKSHSLTSVFVPARILSAGSSYACLGHLFERDIYRSLLRADSNRLGRSLPAIMKYSYAFGRAWEHILTHAKGTPAGTVDVAQFQKIDTGIEEGSLFDLFDEHSPEANWFEAAVILMNALEAIVFNRSILVRNIGRESLVFHSIIPAQAGVQYQLRSDDPFFRLGWVCEQILFGSRPDMHYCYLPPATTGTAASPPAWAVCIWTDSSTTTEFMHLADRLQQDIRDAWPYEDKIQAQRDEANAAYVTDRRWSALYDDFRYELRGEHPKAVAARESLFDIDQTYWSCLDIRARRDFVKFIEEQRTKDIAEKFPFDTAKQFLTSSKGP